MAGTDDAASRRAGDGGVGQEGIGRVGARARVAVARALSYVKWGQ